MWHLDQFQSRSMGRGGEWGQPICVGRSATEFIEGLLLPKTTGGSSIRQEGGPTTARLVHTPVRQQSGRVKESAILTDEPGDRLEVEADKGLRPAPYGHLELFKMPFCQAALRVPGLSVTLPAKAIPGFGKTV